MKMAESTLEKQKTPRGKEKLLIMSNFAFSHSVFNRLVWQTHKNQGLFGKGLKAAAMLFSFPMKNFSKPSS